LSKRGRTFIVLPIVMIAISILVREPYVAIMAAFLFSILFYSRFELSQCDVEIDDKISEGNKTVDEYFKIEHVLKGEKELDLVLTKSLEDDFEISEDIEQEEKLSSGSVLSYDVKPISRGYHRLGKLTGWLYDPLGIFKKSIDHDIQEEIVVQSSRDAIKKAKTYSKRSDVKELAKNPLAFTTRTNEFKGIREFQPGDSLRDIHWKSSSKFQKLMTRIYERVSPTGVHIFLDCSPSMRRRLQGRSTKLDHAANVGLQILKNFDLKGHEIGMTAYDHKDILFYQDLESSKSKFRTIYEKVSGLPGSIESKNLSIDRYEDSLDIRDLEESEKIFSKKINQISSLSGRENISGVLSSVDQIRVQSEEKRLIIMISDLEMQPQETIKGIRYLKKMGNKIWVIVPFSPWYEVEGKDEETLEAVYREYDKLENILERLKYLDCEIFELHPDKEGISLLEEWGETKK